MINANKNDNASFATNLEELAASERIRGQTEFRLAAMRMFNKLHMPQEALMIASMDVNDHLSSDEIQKP